MSVSSEPLLLPLAVTMGDPAGIGTEIIIKAWGARAERSLAPFFVLGDPRLFEERARMLSLPIPVQPITSPREAPSHFGNALPLLAITLAEPARMGAPSPANAAATLSAIDKAVDAIREGKARAMVTAPIAKSVLYAAGFKHPGHTEYLAARAKALWPDAPCTAVMMLASRELRVVPLTIHVPVKEVPALITAERLAGTIRIVEAALRKEFAISTPRIAVCGLNPHAGEDGAMGREDHDIIAPVIRDLRREGLAVTGPHPADTMFHAAARRTYDAAIGMYHDQALIPIKTLAFDEGVNVTLGLPFVRTSPDHGTAFDIAAEGRANPTSFIEALKLADALASRRASVF